MSEPTETNDYTEAWASLNQPSWERKPAPLVRLPRDPEYPEGPRARHRVTPRRPANPHTPDPHHHGQHRTAPTLITPGEAVFWLLSAAGGVVGFFYLVGIIR